ncbi:LOW QUALITY PROTEIN: hypothetical protein TorRG33x02_019940 [Trema orientale]|uniref:Uncharacterized protein n=1 Tax=Trema orientale TaxID=63057 RepID=A0A2P5FWN9_TREOI|nr:LOW QUALITY PROTEIN: hypothetical protein TorRG33x02_019940 [Trema orientale]
MTSGSLRRNEDCNFATRHDAREAKAKSELEEATILAMDWGKERLYPLVEWNVLGTWKCSYLCTPFCVYNLTGLMVKV